ncbi:hypothetical protein MGL_3842 [Malassezia globosa CBS 7966]|uniref:Protein transport protein SFT2 n=1 Tax=Malassezia globosa (strain ATCC MYA-4612 / CBS 7966) TaxID=425265 RepID=A8QAW3_MALGO|nr:uncharacterized protein MGL_3842 [Malassezia globosa CBS 7966]EDP41840.1 hypothetical protein MGL_3842 [Malassezia globosa CBS 7966]
MSMPRWASWTPRTDTAAGTDVTDTGSGIASWFRSGLSAYVPLRSVERTNEEEAYISLSHWDRFLGFIACLVGSALCFLFSFLFVQPPILLARPHKFALAFTLGSLLFMIGYMTSMALTLYFALGAQKRLPTVLFAIMQIGCLLTYLANYFPGGVTTLRYAGTLIARGSTSILPI